MARATAARPRVCRGRGGVRHAGAMSEARICALAERPAVEVLVDEDWYEGELRAWFPQEDGTWRGNAAYRASAGAIRSGPPFRNRRPIFGPCPRGAQDGAA